LRISKISMTFRAFKEVKIYYFYIMVVKDMRVYEQFLLAYPKKR